MLSPSTISDYAVGRATNDALMATTAVWFKDEDEDQGERIGPIYLQVPGREELVPFAAAGVTEVEWHALRVALDLGEMLGVEVIQQSRHGGTAETGSTTTRSTGGK